MGTAITVIIILLVIVAVLALVAMSAYNGFVKSRNLIQESWRQVDVELNRRYELIPNLVETVRAYAAHERNTLEDITRLRSQAQQLSQSEGGLPSQQRADVEAELSGAVRNLIVSVEAYPDLKSNTNFLELQRQLAETEDRIANGRRYYNANVRVYNTKVESVPTNLIANMFKFEKATYFEVNDPAVRQAPNVSFGEIAYRGDPQGGQQPAAGPGSSGQQDALPNPQQYQQPTYADPPPRERRSAAQRSTQQTRTPSPPRSIRPPPQHQAAGAATRRRRSTFAAPAADLPLQSQREPWLSQSPDRADRRALSGRVQHPVRRPGVVTEMTYNQLGPSGLTVSTVGLGCNNFGARMADEDVPDGRQRGDRRRHHPVRHRRRLRQRRWLGDPARPGAGRPAGRGRDRDQVRQGHAGRERTGLGRSRLAALHPDRRGEQPAAARHRLDRPLPAAHARPAHPDRGDPGRARRAGAGGQGPLPRLVQPRRLAGGRRRLDRPDQRVRPAFVSAQNEYSWLNRDIEAELVPALEHTGQSLLPYFPLARGLLTGKYRRGEAAPAGTRLAKQSDPLEQADFDTASRRSRSSPPSAGCPCSRSRSAGWRPCRRSGR